MATYTPSEGRQGCYTTFKQFWDDPLTGWQTIAELTEEPYVQYENVRTQEQLDENDIDDAWLKIYVRHNTSESTSFGNGRANYEARGRVFIDIKVPLNDGLLLGDDLVNVVKRAFQGKRAPGIYCGIVFEGATVNELGAGERWCEYRVVASFEYDEAT